MLLTIHIRNILVTPIAMVDTPQTEPRNAALRDIILERRRERISIAFNLRVGP